MPREKKKDSRKKFKAWCKFRAAIVAKYGGLSEEALEAKIKEVYVETRRTMRQIGPAATALLPRFTL